MTATVNGTEVSSGRWSDAVHGFAGLIARASTDVQLRPGEVFGSGTVGTGCLLEVRDETLGRYLAPGDMVELEVERLGRLVHADRGPSMISIESMTPADWPVVRRIYQEGIATGDATLERDAPDWDHFDRSHRHDCRLVARLGSGDLVGWTALTAYSSRRVYSGVAWESVYVAENARGHGVGRALLASIIVASESVGLWTLLAGVLADNAAEPRPPCAGRVPPGRCPAGTGPGSDRPMARRRHPGAPERDRRGLMSRALALRPLSQRSSWMRIRFPAGSRTAQSRTPYGWSVGSWTISTSLACSRSKVSSRSAVARRMLA